MMIFTYALLALAPINIIVLIVESSKRYSTTGASKMAGGVVFRHKSPDLLRNVKMTFVWILITGANVALNMSRLGDRFSNKSNAKNQLIFYILALALYTVNFIYAIIQYMKYDEFRLCDNCFYLGGVKYDSKKYSYTLEDNAVIFSAKHMTDKRIEIPDNKRNEVLSILERSYRKE